MIETELSESILKDFLFTHKLQSNCLYLKWDIRNTPTYATETGISANLMGHWAHTCMQTLLPLRSCFLPLPLFRTNARVKHFT